MKRVEGSFKILIRNLRLNKNEKNKIQENENTLLPREESKDV
jgi:hypothetical protein